jgi:hypothetical protein
VLAVVLITGRYLSRRRNVWQHSDTAEAKKTTRMSTQDDLRYPTGPLYKFRSYDTALDRARVRRMLLRGEIYFARPPEFNDPFEARPRYVMRGATMDEHRELVRRAAFAEEPGTHKERRVASREAAARVSPERLKERERAFHQDLAALTSMFCMSEQRDDLLMWSHYTVSHAGLCVHVDTTRPPFGAAVEVHYSETYPEIPVPHVLSGTELYRLALRTKACSWKSEKEFRLLRMGLPGSDRAATLGLQWNGQVATVPTDRFIGMTLGARMPAAYRRTLTKLANCLPHPFEVWQAKTDFTAYKLDFERVR